MPNVKKREIMLITVVLILIFFLVYIPHLTYRFPIHIDEWNNIGQAIKLKEGIIYPNLSGLELGFRIFLIFLMFFTDIILAYKYLPAIWAVFSSVILFYVIKKKTDYLENKDSFFISIFAIIFFASIKSNVNVLGLWFFTPLTFSIPFIFLCIYFFSSGIEKNNKKMLIISLIIMIFVLISHAPSLLFSVPFLIVYLLINYKKIKENYRFLSLFLLVPLFGIFFFIYITKTPFSLFKALSVLKFEKGWGVLELDNSPLEIYSLTGYFLAIIGFISLIFKREYFKKYLIYLLWPLMLIISIIIFKLTSVSYFSPYQRNLYYLALSLPLLSSYGLFFLLNSINKKILNKSIFKIINVLIIILVIFLTFNFYFSISPQIMLYKTIDENDYKALKFLSGIKNGRVIAPILISDAVFPITKKETIGTIYFSGNRTEVESFYNENECNKKQKILKRNNVRYVLSKAPINCNWKIIYENNDFIYEVIANNFNNS